MTVEVVRIFRLRCEGYLLKLLIETVLRARREKSFLIVLDTPIHEVLMLKVSWASFILILIIALSLVRSHLGQFFDLLVLIEVFLLH